MTQETLSNGLVWCCDWWLTSFFPPFFYQEGSLHSSSSETSRPPPIHPASASLRPSSPVCSKGPGLHTPAPSLTDAPPYYTLAPLGSTWMAPPSTVPFPFTLPSSTTLAWGDVRAEEEAVRHLPRPEAADRPDPQWQPLHERPERPVGAAAGIKDNGHNVQTQEYMYICQHKNNLFYHFVQPGGPE